MRIGATTNFIVCVGQIANRKAKSLLSNLYHDIKPEFLPERCR